MFVILIPYLEYSSSSSSAVALCIGGPGHSLNGPALRLRFFPARVWSMTSVSMVVSLGRDQSRLLLQSRPHRHLRPGAAGLGWIWVGVFTRFPFF